MKRCTACEAVKSLTDFAIARGNRDGRRSACKQCEAKRGRERYHKRQQHEEKCEVHTCERPSYQSGYCIAHYNRVQAFGDPLADKPIRQRGAGCISKDGYRLVADPERPGRQVLQHRMVMERMLGRKLYSDETVHHRNGDRADNRPENLELWSSRHPQGQKVEDLLEWAREIMARYDS